ncbi:hypothetical protein V4HA_01922 [Lactococcus cremoris]|nr:hypothetical protein [Lactococcus cremoris]
MQDFIAHKLMLTQLREKTAFSIKLNSSISLIYDSELGHLSRSNGHSDQTHILNVISGLSGFDVDKSPFDHPQNYKKFNLLLSSEPDF